MKSSMGESFGGSSGPAAPASPPAVPAAPASPPAQRQSSAPAAGGPLRLDSPCAAESIASFSLAAGQPGGQLSPRLLAAPVLAVHSPSGSAAASFMPAQRGEQQPSLLMPRWSSPAAATTPESRVHSHGPAPPAASPEHPGSSPHTASSSLVITPPRSLAITPDEKPGRSGQLPLLEGKPVGPGDAAATPTGQQRRQQASASEMSCSFQPPRQLETPTSQITQQRWGHAGGGSTSKACTPASPELRQGAAPSRAQPGPAAAATAGGSAPADAMAALMQRFSKITATQE